jgi:divalent metal cation (Fe/Co/Zn/Cd) transporter
VRLLWATVAWNGTEVVIAVGLGIAARSLALVAFGADSFFEVFASLAVVWHLQGMETAHRTRRALRLVAVAFAVLAASLVAAAWRVLAVGHVADETWLGMAYMGLAALVMLTLAVLKRSTARHLGSGPLAAEAALSLLDGVKAAAILAALALNSALGWWWADPVAALLVAAFAAKEAVDTWREAG